jgi:uncharacterized protein (TIGR03067 family)
MRPFLVMVLAAGVAAANGPAEKDPTKDEKTQLQGNWQVVTYEEGGKNLPVPEGMKWIFEDDAFAWKVGDRSEFKGTYKVDVGKKPHAITFFTKTGAPTPGIYQLDGDTLKICLCENGKEEERPKEFATRKGAPDNQKLVVLKREKP